MGYAARAYYNSTPYGGRRLRADQIPSPAYIYDSIRLVDTSCEYGSSIIDALNRLKIGATSLAEYPYDEHLCRSLRGNFAHAGRRVPDRRLAGRQYQPPRSGEG